METIKILIVNIRYIIASLFWKRDKTMMLFDAWFGERFADNSRFLFQYLSENKEKYNLSHCVWVTRNANVNEELNSMGYESYMIDSKESIFYHKHAKYHLVCNTPFDNVSYKGELLAQYSFRAKRINLWHGAGIIKTLGVKSNEYKQEKAKKKTRYEIREWLNNNLKSYQLLCAGLGGWDDAYFLSTSKTEKEKLASFFPSIKNKIIVTGYPRNAYRCRCTESENKIVDIINKYKTSILYLPTFRSKDSQFDSAELFESLKELAKEKDILLIQKAHVADDKSNRDYSFCDNILNLNSDFDVNVITPYITFVITDYSSILGDALYHFKPVLLFVPDFEEYMVSDRGLSDDAKDILSAGIKFYNPEEIKEFLSENYLYPENAKPAEYMNVRTRIWGEEDKSIEQICEDIFNQTK